MLIGMLSQIWTQVLFQSLFLIPLRFRMYKFKKYYSHIFFHAFIVVIIFLMAVFFHCVKNTYFIKSCHSEYLSSSLLLFLGSALSVIICVYTFAFVKFLPQINFKKGIYRPCDLACHPYNKCTSFVLNTALHCVALKRWLG